MVSAVRGSSNGAVQFTGRPCLLVDCGRSTLTVPHRRPVDGGGGGGERWRNGRVAKRGEGGAGGDGRAEGGDGGDVSIETRGQKVTAWASVANFGSF